MRKFLIATLMLMPLMAMAQNTWEMPEEEEEQTQRVNPNAKYLAGAVTEQDGHVVFSTTIEAPGKSAEEIYTVLLRYAGKMTREKNQIQSQVVIADSVGHSIGVSLCEWLVFTNTAIMLDRTKFNYILHITCTDGKAGIRLERIYYVYEEMGKNVTYRAEEWITDKYALNKKKTRLYHISGTFRRKTIDRKTYLFNKMESLLK